MSQPLPQSTIEHELKRTLAYRQVSAELRIAYDDMHGLWGGSRLTVQGDGRVERQVRPRGASTPTRAVKQVDVPECWSWSGCWWSLLPGSSARRNVSPSRRKPGRVDDPYQ